MTPTRAIALALLLATNCGAPARRPEETTVVIPVTPTTADRHLVAAEFDRWLGAYVRRPGSVFRVVQVGRARDNAQARFLAAIPGSWGAPNAVANRTAYVQVQRDRIRAALRGSHVDIPAAAHGSSPRIMIVPALDSRGVRWRWKSGTQAAHAASVCDVSSSSMAGSACTARSLVHSFDRWLADGFRVGSTFRVWIVGTSISTTTSVFALQTPELPPAARIAYLLSAREEIGHLLDRAPLHRGSAVIEAMTVAVADLAPRAGSKQLNILSDLRQTSGRWAFERHIPAPREFSRRLAAERLLPDSGGIAVVACGVHFGATPGEPATDARHVAALRDAWTSAFASMRAADVQIRSACDAEAFMDQRR